MYLSGTNERLWLYEYPGSKNCPPTLTNGCYNTGLRDGCGDARQFADYESLKAWAESHGEQLRQVSSAEEAMTLCKGIAAGVAVASNTPALMPATLAPNYQPSGGFTATGQRIVAGGGVQQPSAPIIIQTQAGPVPDFGLPPEPTKSEPVAIQEAGFTNFGVLLIAGLGLGLFLGERRRGN